VFVKIVQLCCVKRFITVLPRFAGNMTLQVILHPYQIMKKTFEPLGQVLKAKFVLFDRDVVTCSCFEIAFQIN